MSLPKWPGFGKEKKPTKENKMEMNAREDVLAYLLKSARDRLPFVPWADAGHIAQARLVGITSGALDDGLELVLYTHLDVSPGQERYYVYSAVGGRDNWWRSSFHVTFALDHLFQSACHASNKIGPRILQYAGKELAAAVNRITEVM